MAVFWAELSTGMLKSNRFYLGSMVLITTNALSKLAINLSTVFMLASCVPFSSYQAAEVGNGTFSALPERFQVNSDDYPLFRLIGEYREGPVLNAYNGSKGTPSPTIKREDLWYVSHRLGNRFLIDSERFAERDKQLRCDSYEGRTSKKAQEQCRQREQSDFLLLIYLRSSSEAYGWQHVKNYERDMDKTAWFRIDDTGDWSGQPWFECVARCDKLERMQREELEEPDPFGGPGKGRIE